MCKKHGLRYVFILSLYFLLLACQISEQRESTNILRIQIDNSPDKLNPALSRLSVSTFIEKLMYLPVARWNPTANKWDPVIVETYSPQVAESGIRYSLVVRKEARWSDGNPIAINDLLYTLKIGVSPYIDNQSWAAYLDLLDTVYVASDTLYLEMNTPYILADEFIAGLTAYPSHILDPQNEMEQILFSDIKKGALSATDLETLKMLATTFNLYGNPEHPPMEVSGPFRVATWKPEQGIVLSRVDSFWMDALSPSDLVVDTNIDTLQFVFIPDPQNAMNAFTSGQLDVLNSVSVNDSILVSSFDGSVHLVPTLQLFYISINLNEPLLSNPTIRKALSLAINREDIIRKLFQGNAEIATGPIHPDKSYNLSRDILYDPETAKMILRDAGCLDRNKDGILDCPVGGGMEKMSFHIWTTRSSLSRNVATLLKSYWADIGVDLQIQSADFKSFLPYLQSKNFEFAALALRQNNILDDPYPLWHSSQSGSTSKNYQSLKDDTLDLVLENLRRALDPAERIELYHRFQERFFDLEPVFFLAAPHDRIGVKEGVELHWSADRPGYDLLRSNVRR